MNDLAPLSLMPPVAAVPVFNMPQLALPVKPYLYEACSCHHSILPRIMIPRPSAAGPNSQVLFGAAKVRRARTRVCGSSGAVGDSGNSSHTENRRVSSQTHLIADPP